MQPTAEQFTEQAWAAIVAAQQQAQSAKHQQLETEHLLLALLQQNGLAGRILSKAGVDAGTFQAAQACSVNCSAVGCISDAFKTEFTVWGLFRLQRG